MEMVRAFLALDLNETVRTGLKGLMDEVQRSGADVKLVEAANLHVTLQFLGDIPADACGSIGEVMTGVRERAFTAEAKGTGVFPNTKFVRVIWAGIGSGSGKISSLFEQLSAGLSGLGYPEERSFTPHITIGRGRSQRNRDSLLRVLEQHRDTSFGTFGVDHISLKKSVLTPSGPIYSDLVVTKLEP